MNKKIIIGVVIAVILILGIFYVFTRNSAKQNISPTTSSPSSFFPLEHVKSIISNLPIINEITDISTQIIDTLTPGEQATTTEPILKKVVIENVADFGFININKVDYPFYISKNKGEIFVLKDEQVLLSNETINNPKKILLIQDKNNYNFYLQSSKEGIDSFSHLIISATTSSTTPTLLPLTKSIKELILTPDKKLLTLEESNDSFSLKLNDVNFKNIQTLWQTPLSEWVIDPGIKSIFLQTKSSSGIPGSLYSLNINTLTITPLANKIPGLTSKTSPDGVYSLISSSENGEIKTILTDRRVKGDSYETPFTTLGEKCIWLDTSSLICAVPQQIATIPYPDSWYIGEYQFNDTLWLLKADQAIGYSLIKDTEIKEKIDAINLKVSLDKKTLYFINKYDSSLWSFDLSGLQL